MSVSIPEALHNPKFRFIKVKAKSKQPIESNWVTEKNYSFDDQEIQRHLKNGGNYGVLGGYGNLVIIDCDTEEMVELVELHLPETLTIQTGRGTGRHYYYFVPDLDKPIRLQDKDHKNLGDIQGLGKQVVGPNSVHPNGNKYKVLLDRPIATIAKENLLLTFREFTREGSEHATTFSSSYQSFEGDLSILDVVDVSGMTKRDNEFFGVHPVHGSTNGQNFWVNPSKNVFFCFRCGRGGGPLEWLAIKNGFINCGEKLRGEAFKKTLALANEQFGVVIRDNYKKTVMNRTTEEIKNDVLTKLASNQKKKATEEIVKLVETKEHILSLRDDSKSEIWIFDDGIYVPNGKSFIKETVREILDEAYTTHIAKEVIDKIEADTLVEPKELFENNYPDEIVVENGILDLKTRDLKPFNPNKVFFSKLPIKYVPDAKCPNIDCFFKNVLKHGEDDARIMEEIFGFCLYKKYVIQKAILLSGNGRNGKSVTLNLLKMMLGPENCAATSMSQLEGNNFAKATLLNKMVNLPGELSARTLKDTSTFKDLTGRSFISADRKFKTPVEFVNYAKLIFAANEIPRTQDMTNAFFTRWIIIEYPYTFLPQNEINELSEDEREFVKLQDPNVIDKLATPEELSGLLNRALDGLDRLFKQRNFSQSKSTEEVKELWIRKSDSIEAFFMDCLVEDCDEYVLKSEFRKHYHLYCKKYGLKELSDRAIKSVLTNSHGVSSKRIRLDDERVRVWEGISFKDKPSVSNNNNNSKNRLFLNSDFKEACPTQNTFGQNHETRLSKPSLNDFDKGMVQETTVDMLYSNTPSRETDKETYGTAGQTFLQNNSNIDEEGSSNCPTFDNKNLTPRDSKNEQRGQEGQGSSTNNMKIEEMGLSSENMSKLSNEGNTRGVLKFLQDTCRKCGTNEIDFKTFFSMACKKGWSTEQVNNALVELRKQGDVYIPQKGLIRIK